ncbi:MAG: N-acetylmuramoyl-L-alanine amidase [Alphaproteobacteria bacterium]|uniref:N-acetylmuramoyl-L-alanine amidase n=1 Tax=Candidatus Nitrobium versatile TaxID=2884831 RepID=A0A953M2N8_9BACT|nr:N-acetylmuramoyl-L-alanine amidase [Candidatus Nitrobium versatile]
MGFLFCLFCLLFFSSAGAETPKAPQKNSSVPDSFVTVRIGKHADRTRIVFEASEEYIQRVSVTMTGENSVKVDFRAPLTFVHPQKGMLRGKTPHELARGIRFTVQEGGCTVTADGLDDIDVSKLSVPPRLVIDMYVGQGQVPAPSPGPTPGPRPVGESEGGQVQADAFSAPEGADIRIDAIVLDAGHGGSDAGALCMKTAEKDVALQFAKDIAAALGKRGKRVFLTRTGDQVLTLRERIKASNQKSPGMFFSIHMSCRNEFALYRARKKPAKDIEGEKKDMAGFVAQAFARSLKNEFKLNVVQEELPLRVISGINAPALLIELPGPEAFRYEGKNRERLVTLLLRAMAYASPVQA